MRRAHIKAVIAAASKDARHAGVQLNVQLQDCCSCGIAEGRGPTWRAALASASAASSFWRRLVSCAWRFCAAVLAACTGQANACCGDCKGPNAAPQQQQQQQQYVPAQNQLMAVQGVSVVPLRNLCGLPAVICPANCWASASACFCCHVRLESSCTWSSWKATLCGQGPA